MIDSTLVIRKISLIAADLKSLVPYAQLSLEEYLAEPINEIVVERYLERIISRMIDINYHVVVELGHPPPKDYFESFAAMGNLGTLPVDFSRTISQMAGLRNRLVHEYNELDAKKVYESLQRAVKDIPLFLDHVHRFVQKQEGETQATIDRERSE